MKTENQLPRKPRIRRHSLRRVAYAIGGGDIGIPLLLGFAAVCFSLAGWTAALFDGSFASAAEIIIRVIGTFIPNPVAIAQGNTLSRIGALLGALTTLTGAILIALATLGERLTALMARFIWSDHCIVIGDTVLARRVAEGFQAAGNHVLRLVREADSSRVDTGPTRLRVEMNADVIVTAGSLTRAKHVVIDLGEDAATVGLGKALLTRLDNPAVTRHVIGKAVRFRKPQQDKLETFAVRISDPIIADQFDDIVHLERQIRNLSGMPVRPIVFDENKVVARHTLARHPLFALAAARGQQRVHAIIIGFGDLGEKLLDQTMLTGMAGSLQEPRVTIIDRAAEEREREFKTRRPTVMDNLDISFFSVDVGLEPLDGEQVSSAVSNLRMVMAQNPVTAIFIALPNDKMVLRTALILRLNQRRNELFRVPVFYRCRCDLGSVLLSSDQSDESSFDRFVAMQAPTSALLKEIADPEGRDALARTLHEAYLLGRATSQLAHEAWEDLPDTVRRANFRAADHVPAKLWTLGFDISKLSPGAVPVLDDLAAKRLSELRSAGLRHDKDLEHLARLEHDRWAIERKLEGWSYAPSRDNVRRFHPMLVPWSELKKTPSEIAKDVDQVLAMLQFVSDRRRGSPNVFLRSAPQQA